MPDVARSIRRTRQFKRDAKRVTKQGRELSKLRPIVDALLSGSPLAESLRDHALSGVYRGSRECHIEPDGLLVYAVSPAELVLIRCGSHAELFRM